MSVQITAEAMTGEWSGHRAVPLFAGEQYGLWVVSWLPGRWLDRNQAITAMVLAEALAAGTEDDRTRLAVAAWAGELGLSGSEAAVLARKAVA